MTEHTPTDWSRKGVDELPDEYPDNVEAEDGPFFWENDNTGRKIWLKPNEANMGDFEAWLVTGENSVVASGETIGDAQAAARRFMENNSHPTGMI